MKTLDRAYRFARHAHRNDVRKYTGEAYINHPREVSCIVASVPHDENMLAAAMLHDVVEDTPVTLKEIEAEFGSDIASLVENLTDVSKPEDGNRKTRKAIDREHSAKSSARAATVKLADLIHNGEDIVKHDPSFAKVFMAEKKLLLGVLAHGDKTLHARATRMVEDFESR